MLNSVFSSVLSAAQYISLHSISSRTADHRHTTSPSLNTGPPATPHPTLYLGSLLPPRLVLLFPRLVNRSVLRTQIHGDDTVTGHRFTKPFGFNLYTVFSARTVGLRMVPRCVCRSVAVGPHEVNEDGGIRGRCGRS